MLYMGTADSKMAQGVIQAPPDYKVDLEHPERKADKATYLACAVGIFLCTLCLVMRIDTKARISRAFGVEDGGQDMVQNVSMHLKLRGNNHT